MTLPEEWRKAAVDRWYDAQDHVGQADTNPEPYIERAADAAVRQVLEHLIDKAKTDSGAVEAMYDEAEKLLAAHPSEYAREIDG